VVEAVNEKKLTRRSFLKGVGLGSAAYFVGKQILFSSHAEALTSEGGHPININDFISSGKTIQDAINAVQNAGGGELYFPPGIYYTSETLRITQDNVILRGANRSASVIAAASSAASKNMIEVKKPGQRILNVKLMDLTLTSDARQVNPQNQDISYMNHCIVLDSSNNVTLNNVRVDHFNGDGLLFQDTIASGGPDQVIVTGCSFSNCRDGLNTNNVGHSTHIYSGTFEFNARYGINTGGRNSVYIKDSDIEQNRNVGLHISHLSNIIVRDCSFENNSRSFVNDSTQKTHIWIGDYDTAFGILIDSCYFHARNMRSLIRLDKAEQISILNNYVDYADQFSTVKGCFVQTSAACKNIYVDDFSYKQTPNVARISNTQYAISDMKPTAVTSLPAPSEALRGFITRVEGGAGKEDELYICVKTNSETYRWAKIGLFNQ
jgi:hypothetical protein